MAPPTITPCSDVVLVLFMLFIESALFVPVLLMVLLESVLLVVVVPLSEQDTITVEKMKAVANAKIGLRIIVFDFDD